MSNVIGIDLGTTNTVVAVVREGRKQVITTLEGDTLIPSVVCVHPLNPEALLVGMPAKALMSANPGNAVFSTKRLMGMQYFDEELGCPSKQENDYRKFLEVKHLLPYKLFPDPEGRDELVRVKIGERYLKPEDVAELILRQAKQEAERFLGGPVSAAVITTPAHFDPRQKAATQRAAEHAGIEVLALMDEPNAAAMSAGYRPDQVEKARWLLVFDFGGGTLDVSLLQVSKDKGLHVFDKSGDNWLGGDDYDTCLMGLVEDRARQVARLEANEIFQMYPSVVKPSVEAAKIELSTNEKTVVNIASCAWVRPSHGGQPRWINVKDFEITRETLERKARPLLERALGKIEEVFQNKPAIRGVVAEVLPIGGSTYIPSVHRALEEQFPGKIREDETVNPMHEVALGAAVYADALARQKTENALRPEYTIRDTVESSLGIECVDSRGNTVYEKLVMRQTPLDKARSEPRTFHATSPNYLAIPVYAGEHEEATQNGLQGLIEVNINPPVDVGHPVHIQLEMTSDRIIRVRRRIDGRAEEVHDLEYLGAVPSGDSFAKMDEMVQMARHFLAQYGDYIDDKQRDDLSKLLDDSEHARDEDARVEAIKVEKRIRRVILYTDQIGNQLFQVDHLAHASSLSQSTKDQLRNFAYQAKALYQKWQKDPSPENMRELKQFTMLFETFLGMAFREAAKTSKRGTGLLATTSKAMAVQGGGFGNRATGGPQS